MNDWEYTWDAIRTGTVTGPESAEKLERFIADVERAAAEKGWDEGRLFAVRRAERISENVMKFDNPYRKEQ